MQPSCPLSLHSHIKLANVIFHIHIPLLGSINILLASQPAWEHFWGYFVPVLWFLERGATTFEM